MDERKVTLSDLKNNNMSNMKVVNPMDILPPVEKENPQQEFIDDIFGSMDGAIERRMDSVNAKMVEAEEFAYAVKERQELEEEKVSEVTEFAAVVEESDEVNENYSLSSRYDSRANLNIVKEESSADVSAFVPRFAQDKKINIEEETKVERIEIPEVKMTAPTAVDASSINFVSDEDILKELEEDQPKKDEEKQMEQIKSKIKDKLKPITSTIDLSTFTVSKSAISVNTALKAQSATKPVHIVDWMLYNSETPISMKEFTGYEIEKIDPANGGRNRFNTYKDIYEMIYSHIVTPNKPLTMEEWLKLTNFYDVDHIYFAIYKACFDKANYIPYSCPHCQNVFVTDDIKVDDMVKYIDDETKNKVADILSKVETYVVNEFEVEMVQISDNYVLGFKIPSIYDIIFENSMLDNNFTTKYAGLLSMISYIDSIYVIDYNKNELKPIDLDHFQDNMVKTVKSRIIKFSKLLQELNSDQLQLISAMINSIAEKNNKVTYVLPEVTCPECKKVIEETPMSAEKLVFTRHQLAGIASI